MTLIPVYRAAAERAALRARRRGRRVLRARSRSSARSIEHPLVLAGALGGIAGRRASAAGVGREVGRSLRLALPFALLVALVNALVYQGGDTLLVRGGEFLGRRWDVTLEATLVGRDERPADRGADRRARRADVRGRRPRRAAQGCSAASSYRSALTASLATRLVPVLARDAGADGRRRALPPAAARPRWRSPARRWRARSTAPWTWPRRSRCAATRGAGGRRAARGRGRGTTCASAPPRSASRGLAIAGAVAGVGEVDAYPTLELELGPARAGARRRRWSRSAPPPLVGPPRAAGGGPCLSRSCAPSGSRYPYPEGAGACAARHHARARARLVHRAGRRVGLRQVDAAARALRARAALPRRRGERRARWSAG